MNKLKSRKLIMALLAVVVGVIKVYVPDFPEDAFYTIVASIMGYVLVQGGVDITSAKIKAQEDENYKPGGTE